MSTRTWIHFILTNDVTLNAIHDGRVYQGNSMRTATIGKPFLVHHMGNETDEHLADDATPSRKYLQIYMHDDIGDYSRIDQIDQAVRNAFRGQNSPSDGIIAVRYLETSQDFDDQTLNTIFRYGRFQLIMR